MKMCNLLTLGGGGIYTIFLKAIYLRMSSLHDNSLDSIALHDFTVTIVDPIYI